MIFLHENSLFSAILSLYILLLLYFPFLSLQFIFSPIIFFTVILLLHVLRLGASQNCTIERTDSDSLPQQIEEKCTIERADFDSPEFDSIRSFPQQIEEYLDVDRKSDLGKPSSESDPKRKSRPIYADSFLEWDVRAPLEVIYEEYEGEDAGENDSRESQMNIIQRYASLSLFYPESDSDASSEGDYPANGGWDDSPEDMCDFRWEGDDREGLIEIALDEKRNCVVDEDNLIEIDLSPER